MPRPRFAKLPEAKRDLMLEAAAKEFAVHGYDGASLNHILEAAGVSKGAAYYYFDDKADLFATVTRHYMAHLMAHANLSLETVTTQSFWPGVLELYRQIAAHYQEMPWMRGLAKAIWTLSQEDRARSTLKPVFDESKALLARMVVRAQDVGAIRSDLPVDLLIRLVLAVDDAADQWLLENLDRLPADEHARISSVLVDGLRRMLAPAQEDKP
jgi:AcrR family transcriptional regulator